MTQAEELESLCQTIGMLTEAAEDMFKRRLNRLERIANGTGYLHEDTWEFGILCNAEERLNELAERVNTARRRLQLSVKVPA